MKERLRSKKPWNTMASSFFYMFLYIQARSARTQLKHLVKIYDLIIRLFNIIAHYIYEQLLRALWSCSIVTDEDVSHIETCQ